MNEYAFDVRIAAAIRVKVATQQEAEATLRDCIDCATVNFGAFPNGDPIIGEGSLDEDEGLMNCYEINGVAV